MEMAKEEDARCICRASLWVWSGDPKSIGATNAGRTGAERAATKQIAFRGARYKMRGEEISINSTLMDAM